MPRLPRSRPRTRIHAIELRKELTDAEVKLWACLRKDQLGVNFRRQHAIGNYIVDFVCIKRKHIEQKEYDTERTAYLKSSGYQVIRFWNNDVMKNINGVIHKIQFALNGENEI